MMQASAFHHVALTCQSVSRTEAFYCETLGFARKNAFAIGEGREIVYIGNGTMYLELFPREHPRPMPPPDADGPAYPAIRHFAFSVADVDAFLQNLPTPPEVSLGPLAFDAFIPGWKSVWLKDPDGNIVEVTQGYTDQQG